ncbi:hypothetical protein SAMD00019534_004330 [Acytostelium subglobosum LB1]|uniref:hypothetical protein n=1 Tax=Acytostelium subglobosum LB1 TaxID=1410327 RepID=UPI0006450626|nr:hypothetical protein SAMD00019534_004330 [Acytostelium subglobosum LB1]GAM17258.1 hypothetical protein SAMD00019534_004330 [Acytostelium subglobosum LB1]|eukprot:XP_012759320.1 hypothetical protein SAMD00019534_004330 [Acytostelium subglobosum LB1]
MMFTSYRGYTTTTGDSLKSSETKSNNSSSSSKRIKIYTKTGDKGSTSLFNGERRGKDDQIFNVLGALDELSAHIGLAIDYINANGNSHLIEKIRELEEIQCLLLDLGSHVATPRSSSSDAHLQRTEFGEQPVNNLEEQIDRMDEHLPPLRNFILPGGGFVSSQLHVCRAVCRRCERDMVPLLRDEVIDATASKYVNRLSDYFFTIARYSSLRNNATESIYRTPKERSTDRSQQRSFQRQVEVVQLDTGSS